MSNWHDDWNDVGRGVLAFVGFVIFAIALAGVAVGVCIGAAIWA
ncbi:hypothetical protein [Methylocaldum sp.]|nr:hypothetical protein [Methylocaldum sp.]HYE38240.1 hypothetical protein [Methylocaldum sp.]